MFIEDEECKKVIRKEPTSAALAAAAFASFAPGAGPDPPTVLPGVLDVAF